ncbi:pilus assembly protein PilP [Roseateles sp. BYS180W]|uniref:Pilus assembly protein PilP n=1 Tax=Roseateles rivi TaxID=3299028 RepID=A0ABW7FRC8_9BURK
MKKAFLHSKFAKATAFALILVLTACSADDGDFRHWVEQQRSNVKSAVHPLEAPKTYKPVAYEVQSLVDPFSVQKLAVAYKNDTVHPNSLLASEMKRRREPLEAHPLDGVQMVGSLVKNGKYYALLKVEGLLYQVKVGDYLGQNFGKITTIREAELSLREIVQDAAGEWIERNATLQLQEKGQ